MPANSAPARLRSQLLEITDDENRLRLAIQEKRLINASEEELKECLRYVYALIGLRAQNFPAGEVKLFLHGFIRQHYGGHTPAEIRLAFEMAITGKLKTEASCYENFSPLYFASIMNSYRVWASDQVRKLEYLEPVERKLTADQIVDINIEFAFCKFQEINKLPIKK